MPSPKPTYTRAKSDQVLKQLSAGTPLAHACRNSKISMDTFRDWISKDYDGLKARYEGAKLDCMESMSADLAKIVEAPLSEEEKEYPIAFKKRELQMKRLQWELEKRHRRVYGNHVSIEQKHTIDLKSIVSTVKRRIESRKMKTVEATSKPTEQPLELPSTIHHEQSITSNKK